MLACVGVTPGAQAYGGGLAILQHILGDIVNFSWIQGLFAFDRDADVGDGEYFFNQHGINLHRSTAFMQAAVSMAEATTGPELPSISSTDAAPQLPQTGHSCFAQNF
ncbi:hypothetical protein [Roseovarius sp. E0-M6]|uniref:hypothetical protein n=1 Tax=Roseovarius sp. E0-M6 TaxID=3127118 RepID=UPI0030101250